MIGLMKKMFVIIANAMTVLIVVGVLIIFFFWYTFVGNSNFVKVAEPKIKYGEFPIAIIYELEGKTKKIEDVIICEFDGFETRGEAGKYRKWKSYLKSGNSNFGFLPVEKDGFVFEVGIILGSPNYYMGDFEESKNEYERKMTDNRYLEYVEWKDGVKTGRAFTKEEIWEMYKLRIIDIKYSQPIKNSFEEQFGNS